MVGDLNALFAATVLFVGGHFLLSSQPIRDPAVKALGAQGFMIVYSLAVTGALLWMATAYNHAPFVPVWTPPVPLRWVPNILMPLAAILLVAGLTTRSPTVVGGEKYGSGPQDPVPGILRITRHPFLWATTLWSLGHLATNGDAAGIILFGGILVLSVGGMHHIGQKRERVLGAAWGPIALTTSVIPFQAILARRTKFDWKGIGFWRPIAGIALYAALLLLHPLLFGVSALPA
jgi:uncharacterized membrane protein